MNHNFLKSHFINTLLFSLVCLFNCNEPAEIDYAGPMAEWPSYGGTQQAQRYSPLTQLTRENVDRLEIAWEYHTGDVSDGRGKFPSTTAFEATPILVDGTLYVPTPFNRVIALDPETGEERWSYNPKIDLSGHYANQLICRGVSFWRDGKNDSSAGRCRIFMATNDARLIAAVLFFMIIFLRNILSRIAIGKFG